MPGDDLTHVWVYGSLRAGKKSHHLLGRSELVGSPDLAIGPGSELPDDGAWCLASSVPLGWEAAAKGAGTVVHGETYAVDSATLAKLDDLEGYTPGQAADSYDRQKKKLSDGSEALVYVIRRSDAEERGKYIAGETERAIERLPFAALMELAQSVGITEVKLLMPAQPRDRLITAILAKQLEQRREAQLKGRPCPERTCARATRCCCSPLAIVRTLAVPAAAAATAAVASTAEGKAALVQAWPGVVMFCEYGHPLRAPACLCLACNRSLLLAPPSSRCRCRHCDRAHLARVLRLEPTERAFQLAALGAVAMTQPMQREQCFASFISLPAVPPPCSPA
jgi:gamma-glutamylcyclotransferase (GGCT)/AIG2-like uncharacterized protein YtfP